MGEFRNQCSGQIVQVGSELSLSSRFQSAYLLSLLSHRLTVSILHRRPLHRLSFVPLSFVQWTPASLGIFVHYIGRNILGVKLLQELHFVSLRVPEFLDELTRFTGIVPI